MPKGRVPDARINDKCRKVASKYNWTLKKTDAKIAVTRILCRLGSLDEAANFLLGPSSGSLICDGCNVRGLFEHRCHGNRSVVGGEQTNKKCHCPDCFVVNELGFR